MPEDKLRKQTFITYRSFMPVANLPNWSHRLEFSFAVSELLLLLGMRPSVARTGV